MKKIIRILLPLLLVTSALKADCGDDLTLAVEEMHSLYNTGPSSGCRDCIFESVSASMLGWGIGLAAGIAILTGLIHNHRAHSSSNTTR